MINRESAKRGSDVVRPQRRLCGGGINGLYGSSGFAALAAHNGGLT
jgi:hypothetical protein